MKKILTLMVAALLVSGASYACDDHKKCPKGSKEKSCCKKEGKCSKDKKDKKTKDTRTTTTTVKA